jgi:hypothetical protein
MDRRLGVPSGAVDVLDAVVAVVDASSLFVSAVVCFLASSFVPVVFLMKTVNAMKMTIMIMMRLAS